jgi:hypothetical protein
LTGEIIGHLHETEEDIADDDPSMPRVERQYRKILRLTIGAMEFSPLKAGYQSTEDSLRKLLSFRPSVEDMKMILKPMCYLSGSKPLTYGESLERDRYHNILQQELIEYFLDKYHSSSKGTASPQN